MRKIIVTILLVVLPVVGALVGRWSGPGLSHVHDTVRLAQRVQMEERFNLTERTLESEAFRQTGRTTDDLLTEAREVRGRFVTGGMYFGAWCGLALGVTFYGLNRTERRETYDVDVAWCVGCGRCFRFCPREHVRLRGLRGASREGAGDKSS